MAESEHRDYDISRESIGLAPKDEPKAKKEVEKIADGKVVKKSRATKLAETFLGGDIRDVVSYVAFDVVIPSAKSTFLDVITQGLERLLYGETRSDRSRTSNHRNYTSYSQRYRGHANNSSYNGRIDTYKANDRSNHAKVYSEEFNDIVLNTRDEAEAVLTRMYDAIDTYGVVSVAELYSLVGISSDYTQENWGWKDLRSAHIQRIRDGFRINLPKPEEV